MIYQRPVKYVYEKSSEVITLENIPVAYDEAVILEVERKLALIENDTEIGIEVWNQGIPYEQRGRYSSLIEESEPGLVTMSAIGLLFFEKFKTDYPPDLEKDLTSPENKSINVRDDHGKDILVAFAKRLVNSLYVRKVINSLPYNPKQKDPVKECYEDGRVELVLVDTDQGLGLLVQTTGKNLRETISIASLLRKKYIK